ncbi:MAG: VOC family protein [Acidobacteria bacterium]|nr:VOC family protein [Acidobacteriota bacterium]
MTSPAPSHEKFRASASVSITVKDIQKSLTWYQDVLGFGVERAVEHEGRLVFVGLKAGDARLALNQDDGAKGWDRVKALGFSVNFWTTEDIDAIASRIKASGGTLDSEPVDAPWGARFFRLTDPDGFKLAVLKSLT